MLAVHQMLTLDDVQAFQRMLPVSTRLAANIPKVVWNSWIYPSTLESSMSGPSTLRESLINQLQPVYPKENEHLRPYIADVPKFVKTILVHSSPSRRRAVFTIVGIIVVSVPVAFRLFVPRFV